MFPINPMIDPKTRQISGPINIVRLEGNVNNVHKVIYLFMDDHIPVSKQTECKNIFSSDVQKYFANSFYQLSKNNDRIYDFFLEIHPTKLLNQDKKHTKAEPKERYIDEMMKFFRKIFNYDKRKNKVIVNKLFKNVRLHYLDVRSYYKYEIQQEIFNLVDISRQMLDYNEITTKNIEDIIDILKLIKKQINYIIAILSKKRFTPTESRIIKPDPRLIDTDAIEYLTNKLKKSYKHKNVQESMLKLIEKSVTNFQQIIDEINRIIDTFNGILKKFRTAENRNLSYNLVFNRYDTHHMITKIIDTLQDLIDNKITEFFARFTDIYFLRRFLDKDYITNAIVYTGAYHSTTYIHTLVNSFDFKVTHASYSKIANMDKLNSKIKKMSALQIENIIIPDANNQCSDMSGFPDNFL